MIRQVSISNFRSIKKVVLDFVDGVNVLIGLPDAGKTNVIRAIQWVLTNRPLGKRMMSDFSDDPTSVSIAFDGGNAIELEKTKKQATYRVNGHSLKGMGSDVPDEVEKSSNMGDINLQRQLDSPFLICSSSGEVAKVFNRITRLEKPDKAIAMLTTDINSEGKALKIHLERRHVIEQELNRLKDVPSMDREFKLLRDMNIEMDTLDDSVRSLGELIDEISENEKLLEDMSCRLEDMAKASDGFDDDLKSYKRVSLECEHLEDTIREMENLESEIETMKLSHASEVDEFKEFLDTIKVCPYCKVCKEPIKNHDLEGMLKGIDL
jgi:DNA repair ATPase RecN